MGWTGRKPSKRRDAAARRELVRMDEEKAIRSDVSDVVEELMALEKRARKAKRPFLALAIGARAMGLDSVAKGSDEP